MIKCHLSRIMGERKLKRALIEERLRGSITNQPAASSLKLWKRYADTLTVRLETYLSINPATTTELLAQHPITGALFATCHALYCTSW